MRSSLLLFGTLAVTTVPWPSHAQDRDSRPERDGEGVRRTWSWFADDDRAVLGLSTSSSGKRDTLGLLITTITPGGPAEKAGLEEGNRIAAINGVNLRLAPADAGERDMAGLTTRRMRRELEKVKPGDEVELRVYDDGRLKTVKAKTVSAADLTGRHVRFARGEREERAAIGVTLSGGGSRRDTLGVLIVRVAPDGPAEKAGLVEGDRIAAINGVDLRVARDEADETGAKASRLRRELRNLKPGADVELRVYSGGQFKTVRLKAAKRSELYGARAWHMLVPDDLAELEVPHPPLPPLPSRPPLPPDMEMEMEDLDVEVTREIEDKLLDVQRKLEEGVRVSERELQDALRELRRRLGGRERTRQVIASRAAEVTSPLLDPVLAGTRFLLTSDQGGPPPDVVAADREGDPYTLILPGLQATVVDDELASYFGEGSEGGLLVLDVADPWTAVREGDVILKINGECVRRDDHALFSLRTDRPNEVELLRKGRRMTVQVREAD